LPCRCIDAPASDGPASRSGTAALIAASAESGGPLAFRGLALAAGKPTETHRKATEKTWNKHGKTMFNHVFTMLSPCLTCFKQYHLMMKAQYGGNR